MERSEKMRVLVFASLLLLSGCGYSSAEYWDMVKSGVARSLCNVAAKSSGTADCQPRDGIRP
jgi:hypothetical protein